MLAALLWSLDGVFIRPKLYHYPAGLIVFLEHFLGFIVLSPFIILYWPKIKLLRKKDWGAIFWVSIFGGLIGTIMITKAFFSAVAGEVTFATVVILQKLQPFFALLLARIILKEKLKRKFYLWAIVAIIAAYFLAFGKTSLDFTGISFYSSAAFFAFLAAFAFGSSTVFGKRIVNHLDFKSTTALRFGITSILALLLIFLNQDLAKLSSLGGQEWKLLIIIVFTSGAGAMFIYYYGLKRVTASTATICELIWPLSAVILDYILNRNVLNYIQIIASLFLLIAFYQVIRGGQAKPVEFSAKILSGLGRGQRLGFPTINLDNTDLDINYGLYLAEAEVEGANYKGLLHFGSKDTFNEGASLELYIKENINTKERNNIKVRIIKKIRDIKKFASAEDLKLQIAKDIEKLERS